MAIALTLRQPPPVWDWAPHRAAVALCGAGNHQSNVTTFTITTTTLPFALALLPAAQRDVATASAPITRDWLPALLML
jgi:hypothetical protein